MNDARMEIAYFWEPITAVASLLLSLFFLGMAIWLIYELKKPLHVDEYEGPITPAKPSPDPESQDSPAEGSIAFRHWGQ